MNRISKALLGFAVGTPLVALLVAGSFASASPRGFQDYRQAAADQYCDGNCSTGNSTGNTTGGGTTGGSTSGNATGNATGNSNGNATGNSNGNATGNSNGTGTGNPTGNGPAAARSGTAPERVSGGVDAKRTQSRAASGVAGAGAGNGLAAAAANGSCVPYLYFFRPVSRPIVDGVTKALALMSLPAPHVVRLSEPMNLDALTGKLGAGAPKDLAGDSKLIRLLGTQNGKQVAYPRPLIDTLDPALFDDVTLLPGELRFQDLPAPFVRACVVVLARAHAKGDKQQRGVRNHFEAGFDKGLRAMRVPLAAVELTKTKLSQIKWFKSHHLSSVDDIDTSDGQQALALILQGAKGTYGVKATAQALMPKPVAVRTLPSGTPFGPGDMTFWILVMFGLVAARFTIAAGWRLRRARASSDDS